METIKVECTGAGTLSIDQLEPMQGELKTLSNENFEKLKKEILTDGFSYPMAVWENNEDAKIYILDGHQRYAALQKMRKEGYSIPQVPIVFVNATDFKHAKRKLLAAASQYGDYNQEGFLKFVGSDINFEEMATSFNFPTMDMKFLMDQMSGFVEPGLTTDVMAHKRNLEGEESEAGENKDNQSQVRMIQLFLDGETQPEFLNMCLKLQDSYGTLNLTDTVMEAVREAFNGLKEKQ